MPLLGNGLAETWIASEYEVDNGFISPAKGASFRRVDLAKEYVSREASLRPWYLQLAALGALASDAGRTSGGLEHDQRVQRLIRRFCARAGLLGTLLQRTHAITLMSVPGGGTPDAVPITYTRTQGRWLPFTDISSAPANQSPATANDCQGRVESGLALMLDAAGSRRAANLIPCARAWAPYFRDLPATAREGDAYPPPGSEEFWRRYREPVKDFLAAAGTINALLTIFVTAANNDVSAEGEIGAFVTGVSKDEYVSRTIELGRLRLSELLEPIGISAGLSDNLALHQRWSAATPLAAHAVHPLNDIESGRVRRCERCGKLFVSDSYQTRYCSERCRFTVQKRRHRSRKQSREV